MTNKSIRDYINLIENAQQKDMTSKTCEKCKKGKYQERSQHDDMDGKVTCSCGHRVNRWKNYKEQSVAEEQLEETTPESVSKVEELFRNK